MANFLDNLEIFTSRAQVKIADEAYAAALLIDEGLDATKEINNVIWWTQLVTGSNDTNQSDALRLALLTLLVNNAHLITPQQPVGVFALYQPISPTVTASATWGFIGGIITNQTDLMNLFAQYLPLAGGTMTGPLLIAPTTRIDSSTSAALNIGTVNAETINLGGVGVAINTGTIGTGVWNASIIGGAFGGNGLNVADGGVGQVLVVNASRDGYEFATITPGTGDVVGPASATDNAIARFNLTTGKLIQDSVVTIADTSGNMAGVGTLNTHTIQGGTASTFALYTNKLSVFAATSSAELAGVISDETGSGALVFANTPTLVTPIIGAATGTSLTVTGALTSGVASSAAGTLVLRNATNAFTQTIRGTGLAASRIFDLPIGDPSAGQSLTGTLSGSTITLAWASALTNPMDNVGQLIYGGSAGVPTKLAANLVNAKRFLTETAIGGIGQAPVWSTVAGSDLSSVVPLALGGTATALVNPAANRIMGWDNATSAVSFMVIGAGLTYTAGTKTLSVDASGIVVSVTGTANRITSTGGSTPVIDISAAYVGQSSITTLGTIATGDWQAGIIDGEFGGTGLDVSTGTIGDSIRISALGEWEFYTPSGGGGGTVTTVSVVTANGFAGSVANATTTPAITLTTSVTGILKGNGTAISAATAGTDYVVPGAITGSGLTMATARILGRTTASTGAIEELTGANVTAMLSLFATGATTQGLVPGSNSLGATYYLDGSGTWSIPVGSGGSPGGSTTEIQWNNAGAFGGIATSYTDGTDVRFKANAFYLTDNATTPSKQVTFSVTSISAATIRTWAFPDFNDTFVGVDATQTLTNKTLTSPVINVGSDATGDIYYRNAGGLFTRLGVGSNGDILTLAAGLPSWVAGGGGSGVTTVGAFSGSSQTNGASISGVTITFGPADGTNPGMVTTGTQTFAGVKTLTSPSITTSLVTGSTSFDLLNTTATTVNFAGAATTLAIGGAASSTITLGGGAASIIKIGGGATATELRFLEPSGSGTNYTAFKAQAQAGDVTYTLPAADGSNTNVLQTNGAGVLSWVAAGAGSGVTTMAAIGVVPNANGASISGVTLTLQPADASFGGVVTTGTQTLAGAKTFSSSMTLSAAGSTTTAQLVFSGATNNWISYGTTGTGAPAFTTRSLGTKIVLYTALSGSAVDYSIGVVDASFGPFIATANTSSAISFYGGTTRIAYFQGSGDLVINNTTFTILTTTPSTAIRITTGSTGIITKNFINLGALTGSSLAAPATVSTNWAARSLGTRLIVQSSASSSDADAALGFNTASFWFSTQNSSTEFRWYGGATSIMSLGGDGVLTLAGALNLRAGTASAGTAPLVFTSGTNLTTPVNGTMEYNGTNLFFTRAGAVRENVLVAVDNATAPSTSVGVVITNFYGSSATNFLGDPNRWLSVNVLGTVYKIPLYS